MRDIHVGKFVIVADDEDRENEGDLICGAELVTAEMVNFMIKRAGGLICLAMAGERIDQLGLTPMAETNQDAYRTAYTVSIDAASRSVSPRVSARRIARQPFASRSIPIPPRRICATADTSSRCVLARAACCSVSVIPRPRSISRASLDSRPPG